MATSIAALLMPGIVVATEVVNAARCKGDNQTVFASRRLCTKRECNDTDVTTVSSHAQKIELKTNEINCVPQTSIAIDYLLDDAPTRLARAKAKLTRKGISLKDEIQLRAIHV